MHKINEEYKYTHPHTHGMSVLTPEYSATDQVVVTIKSLATGLTMKVYLDEPTLTVNKGINVTTYTGHFNEKGFIYTPSEGLEITGFPLVYPYSGTPVADSGTVVIDTKNHSLIYRDSSITGTQNLISFNPKASIMYYVWTMLDFPPEQESPTSGNVVVYDFSRFSDTSDDSGTLDDKEPRVPKT